MPGQPTPPVPPGLPLVLLSGLLLSGLTGCSETEGIAATPRPAPPPLRVRVVRVAEQDWDRVVATQGNLVADETTVVGTKVAGRIDRVHVDLGDFVEAGTVLASLDRRELQEQVRQAEAELVQARAAIGLDPDDALDEVEPETCPIVLEQKALWDQARADRDRSAALRNRQVATDTEYETALTAEQVAKARHASAINSVREMIAMARVRAAQLELARQALADAEIRAPFDGRVQDRRVAPGMYVQVGDPVITLIRDDPLRYRGTVPEAFASSLAIGQVVRLRVQQGPALPDVEISRISPAIDPFSRSLLFEARVPNTDHAIQAGQFSQGEVMLDESRRTIALPGSAVVEFAGTRKVWKVVDGQAVEQPIELGLRRGDLVEILGGLDPGDLVLVDGSEGRTAEVEIRDEVIASLPGAGAGGPPSP
ncbi:efflux RND transporter periplasmic adaptor subunit [Tautonia plasticadhaerens]|uniref:Multidrug resistance protein MdtA n=1 Tax=Tautonia plasticadhaerens TaxID=2527974 RepID=A0A518GUZ3_9BACT|nr:efflux RND transporter periplasmic adaptor subunit [Tautonia plasticadhaerens]QDV32401.1 Multidrug resistance protein MdtA precursor [Tautonia plasticadhaerens]